MSQVPRSLDVLTHEIGPRPAFSDTERQAAEWLQDRFVEAGVPAELHDFDAPRSPQSARIFTYLLVPIALFGIGAGFLEQMWVIHWLCWIVLAALSVLTLLDFHGPKGPAGLIALLPKGPSQNVIAKSIPSSFTPGEKSKKIILVANYDSDLVSPLSAEATAALQRSIQALANGIVVVMPLLALPLVSGAVIPAQATVWFYRVLLFLCLPGALLLINQLIARIMNRYSPGANNNASGVAALLASMDLLAEGQQGHSGHTTTTAAVKLAAAEAKAAAAAKQSSKMPGVDYTPPTGASTKMAAVPLTASPDTSSAALDIDRTKSVEAADAKDKDKGKDEGDSLSLIVGDLVIEDFSSSLSSKPEMESADVPQRSATPAREDRQKERFVSFETVEFSSLGNEAKVEAAPSYAALDDYDAQTTFADEQPALATEVLDAGIIGAPPVGEGEGDIKEPTKRSSDRDKSSRDKRSKRGSGRVGRAPKAGRSQKKKKGLFSFGKKGLDASHVDDPTNWLGLDQDFDARKDGKLMGTWDNFGEGVDAAGDAVGDLADSSSSSDDRAPMEDTVYTDDVVQAPQFTDEIPPPPSLDSGVVDLTDSFAPLGGFDGEDDDGFAWKGGFAGDDPIEDAEYASAEAARIRRKVVESLDVDLKEKEVWFVLTGAGCAERAGIRAFMNDYGDQLRDALFINVSAVGSGDLYWSSKERSGRSYLSSARLTSTLRRLSRESQVRIKPWKKGALVSDAGPILAAGRKAVSIVRLNEKGAPFALASAQDTAARLDSNKIDEVAQLVCSIIREA